jgi:competence protein ComEC
VIKVPHHGSATSSTVGFVTAVRPQLAVMSAGFANRYGFPAPAVLGRYAAESSRVLRTDLDGAVELRIDASGTLRVRTGSQRDWRISAGSRANAAAQPFDQFEKSN